MVENNPFLFYGDEEPIQKDIVSTVRLIPIKEIDFIFFIEFIYIDGLADVWAFTCEKERELAFEYAQLSLALSATVNRIHARLN